MAKRVTAIKSEESGVQKISNEAKAPNVLSKPRYKLLPTVWHASMVAFYVFVIYLGAKFAVALVPYLKGKVPTIGGQFKYLTTINIWFQLLFFSLQLMADITCGKGLQRACSYVFTTIVFPTSASIVAIFWPIYFIDNNLIFPDLFVKTFPWYMNHFWHSTILLWVLLEVYFVKHHFTSNFTAVTTILSFGSLYNAWVLFIHYKTDHWVYPFLGKLSYPQVEGFFIFSTMLSISMYFLAKKLTSVCWRQKKCV